MILALSIKSLRNRRATAMLTVVSIALAVALLLGVEKLRADSETSFASAVSGVDLVVGARSGPVNLLLATVFRIGDVTGNLRWETYRAIASRPEVAWTIPLSLGDSHRGFRVLGTNDDYFRFLRDGDGRALAFAEGRAFATDDEAVLGSGVARRLGYRVGQSVAVAHGTGDVAFTLHASHPFRVVGILAPTGTPVDRAIHVSLGGIDAMHAQESDDPLQAALERGDAHRRPAGHAISGVLVGLRSRAAALGLQRQLDTDTGEPLTAVLPGVTLLEVWQLADGAQKALRVVSAFVVVGGLATMLIALLASLNERRREMAVLRAIGARPLHVLALVVGEAAVLTIAGVIAGVVAVYAGLAAGRPWLEAHLGLFLVDRLPSTTECALTILVVLAGIVMGAIPAYKSYRMSLSDGMTVRT